MKKRIITLILASSLSIAHANSFESSPNWYLGGFVGQSDYDVSLPDPNATPSVDFDHTDTAFKLIAGYEFNEYFAIEGGYTNLGELTLSYNKEFNDGTFSYSESSKLAAEVDGFIVNLVGKLPITESTHLYAKVGSFSWDVEASSSYRSVDTSFGTTNVFTDRETAKEDGSDVFYGIGVGYKIDNFTLKAEFEMMESDDQDIDVISIGATYHF